MITTISSAEFKRRLSDFLGRVMHKHEHIIITRHGRPVAQLAPLDETPTHLSEVKGWVDDHDAIFPIWESIVADRAKHLPRTKIDPK